MSSTKIETKFSLKQKAELLYSFNDIGLAVLLPDRLNCDRIIDKFCSDLS